MLSLSIIICNVSRYSLVPGYLLVPWMSSWFIISLSISYIFARLFSLSFSSILFVASHLYNEIFRYVYPPTSYIEPLVISDKLLPSEL